MTPLDILTRLGDRLGDFGHDAPSQRAMEAAMRDNPWFGHGDIMMAVCALREKMLRGDVLREWLARYGDTPCRGATLGIIMAGNIPLVGFHDLMCGIAAGCRCLVKTSSKDSALMSYIVDTINDPSVSIGITTTPDMLIATGSDNTVRQLQSQWPGVRALWRGSRSSAAILTGDETDAELEGLAHDIFSYSGLGCRSVSFIWLPHRYDIQRLANKLSSWRGPVNPKYRNNYLQNKAIAAMAGRDFVDGGFFTLCESDEFPLNISEISYSFYDDNSLPYAWTEANGDHLQCLVARPGVHPMAVGFGCAQYPGPDDYPDRIDTMKWLGDCAL